tara:strand:- start:1074 stop:1553 length:480 start_codon:yes stop_codon:yes gene_type:complete
MKLESALKKIRNRANRVNLDVEIQEQDRGHDSIWYVRFEGSNQVVSFYDKCNGEDRIYLIKVTRDGDVSDPHVDYFAGSFVDNITQALNWVAPLPPKYPVGSLIRFKDNKRNTRAKLAGKVGLVTEAQRGGGYKIDVIEQRENPRYDNHYYERDLEKAS